MCVQFYLLLVAFMVRISSDVSGFPVASIELSEIEQRQRLREMQQQQQQRLDIYKRQNSAFNRLQSNKIDYSVYSSFNDQAPVSQEQNDISTSESRRYGGKRRPCIPAYSYRMGKKRRRNDGRLTDGRLTDGRTLYDLNFYFLGYQPDRYQVNPGSQTVSAIAAVDNNPVSQNQYYDHNGGYLCRPPYLVGSNDYYGDGGQYTDPNRPSYLGLLGQGLFDFINGLFGYGNPNAGSGGFGGGSSGGAGGSGGYDTPVSSGAGTVLNESNGEKPVYEINVPDTIAALVMHFLADFSMPYTYINHHAIF